MKRITGILNDNQCIHHFISRVIFLRMRNVLRQVVERDQNTHFMFNSSPPPPENCAVYEIMWKYCPAGHARWQYGAKNACMLDKNGKNTNTHSEYVILVAFSTANNGYANAPQCYVIRTLPILLSHTIFRLSKLILPGKWVSGNIFPAAKFSYDFPFYWQALLTTNQATKRTYTLNLSYSPYYVELSMLVTLVRRLSTGKIWLLAKKFRNVYTGINVSLKSDIVLKGTGIKSRQAMRKYVGHHIVANSRNHRPAHLSRSIGSHET
jgi:hypothetical protein